MRQRPENNFTAWAADDEDEDDWCKDFAVEDLDIIEPSPKKVSLLLYSE